MNAESRAPLGRYLFENGPPAPPHLAGLAAPFVARARLAFKDFRKDYERIGGAVVKAKTAGAISPDDATLIWFDVGQVLSRPLVERYCEARAFAPVDRWIRAREGFSCTEWLGGYVLLALERFVAAGEGPRAAALVLAHAERAMRSLRQDWKERRRKLPAALAPGPRDAAVSMQRALVARIPLRNADMLNELAELEPWTKHGIEGEAEALSRLRAEILADQERFPAT